MTDFEKEVLQGMAVLNTKFDGLEKKIASSQYDPRQCAVHEEKFKVANKRIGDLENGQEKDRITNGKRITKVERQQGKQNLVVGAIGAVGTGLAFLVKYIFTRPGV